MVLKRGGNTRAALWNTLRRSGLEFLPKRTGIFFSRVIAKAHLSPTMEQKDLERVPFRLSRFHFLTFLFAHDLCPENRFPLFGIMR